MYSEPVAGESAAAFPGGKRFAFTVFDDTDVATVDNVRPLYLLLEELGMRATKTVWPLAHADGPTPFRGSETLEDPSYRDFVVDLHHRGFEVAWHGATMESSTREETILGLQRFHEAFGLFPRLHANHALNRENLYWGADRVDDPAVRAFARRVSPVPDGHFQGHREATAYWWGDLARRHIEYGRNLTFDEINLARVNPSMPYRDPRRPLVRWWFSASDAEDCAEFNRLTHPKRQARLEAEGGFCIVATHFGKGFVRDGEVHRTTRRNLERLAERDGWFPTVGELLDWLRARRSGELLPEAEWRRMQWRWLRDLGPRKLRAHFR